MPRRGGGAGASSNGGEPPEEEENQLNRFLRPRKRGNVDSNYHPTHNKKSLARLPHLQRGEPPNYGDNREELTMQMPLEDMQDVDEREFSRLKQATSHLPDDKVMQLLAHYEYDVDTTITVARQMVSPDLMPQPIKDFMIANIAMERQYNPSKKTLLKEFYFEYMMKKSVDTKCLVDFYYNEKNKIGGNWRIEHDDPEETPEEIAEREQKMIDAGISIIVRDPTTARQRQRSTRAQPTRHSARTRRSEVDRLRGSPDSDTSDSNGCQPSTSGPQPRINLRFRFTPALVGTADANISIITGPRDDNQPSTSTAGDRHQSPPPEDTESPRRRHSTRLSIDQAQQQQPSTSGIAPRTTPKSDNRKRRTT